MHQLTKISAGIAAVGLSAALLMGTSNADSTSGIAVDRTVVDSNDSIADTINNIDGVENIESAVSSTSSVQNTNSRSTAQDDSDAAAITDVSPVTNGASGVSQKLTGNSKAATSLNKFLPTIKYTTENLPDIAQKVNSSNWKTGEKIDRTTGTKLQALLNWQQSGVGPVDGYWGKNTLKAMQAFQKARGLTVTETLNDETWSALTKNTKLMAQPVLVSYQLTDADVNIKTITIPAGAEAKAKLDGMYYETVIEGLAEKFHMSENYLKSLNPKASFNAGEDITVYNPGNPNTKPVSRVVADKTTQTLYAYDDKDNLIASYPTTVGSTATPSPTGTHKVQVKVHEPNYTYTREDGKKSIIPPGPNNPVGSVWIGLSKPSYGIHGSPDPARISRQASAGCVRLTNWDALALLGTIQNGATVEFK